VNFDEGDVVRHHLVQRIVRAYDEHKARATEGQMSLLAEPRHIEPASEKAPASDERAGPVAEKE
jgi:hypothetical protein